MRRDGEAFEVSLKPKAPRAPGTLRGKVLLRAKSTSGEELPAWVLPIAGQVQEDVFASPEVVTLRFSHSGQDEPRQSISLSTRSGTEIEDVAVTNEGDSAGLRCGPLTRQAASSFSLDIWPAGARTEVTSTQVHLQVRLKGEERPLELVVPVILAPSG